MSERPRESSDDEDASDDEVDGLMVLPDNDPDTIKHSRDSED